MAERKVTTRIEITGESEYKQAIKDLVKRSVIFALLVNEVMIELAITIISLITAIINLTITIIKVTKLKNKNED